MDKPLPNWIQCAMGVHALNPRRNRYEHLWVRDLPKWAREWDESPPPPRDSAMDVAVIYSDMFRDHELLKRELDRLDIGRITVPRGVGDRGSRTHPDRRPFYVELSDYSLGTLGKPLRVLNTSGGHGGDRWEEDRRDFGLLLSVDTLVVFCSTDVREELGVDWCEKAESVRKLFKSARPRVKIIEYERTGASEKAPQFLPSKGK